MAKVLIVGAGFAGAVIAQQLAEHTDHQILVVDERSHVAGNCHTERHAETGILVHAYGPHIFNTSNEAVWRYVQRFGEFRPFINRVKAVTAKGVFSLPINLLTINQVFGTRMSPQEAKAFVASQADTSIVDPANFEEQALKLVGPTLYELFFRGYTIKQWGCDPRDLPASILKRLPVRFSYDDNYYDSLFQGIPVEGYTAIVERMLQAPTIQVKTDEVYEPSWNGDFDYVFYSGPIDRYFGHAAGRLGYRTIYFESETHPVGDVQGNAVINYCEDKVPFTRVHEHGHFAPWERRDASILFKEFSKETGADDVPFYPKRLAPDMAVLRRYRELAEREERVSFIGRLGTYRYMDMHHVIDESLHVAAKAIGSGGDWRRVPTFPNVEPALS